MYKKLILTGLFSCGVALAMNDGKAEGSKKKHRHKRQLSATLPYCFFWRGLDIGGIRSNLQEALKMRQWADEHRVEMSEDEYAHAIAAVEALEKSSRALDEFIVLVKRENKQAAHQKRSTHHHRKWSIASDHSAPLPPGMDTKYERPTTPYLDPQERGLYLRPFTEKSQGS